MTLIEQLIDELPERCAARLNAYALERNLTLYQAVVSSLIDGLERSGDPLTGTDRILRVEEAAKKVGLSVSMLNKMRVTGIGPKFIKMAPKAVGYSEIDLMEWLKERRTTSTSAVSN